MENVGPKMTMAPVYLRERNYRIISVIVDDFLNNC